MKKGKTELKHSFTESSTTTEEVAVVVADDSTADDEGGEAEGDDDQAEFHAEESTRQRPAVSPRWPTRVFAAQSVRRIITACLVNKQAHFDLALAKEMQLTRGRGKISNFEMAFFFFFFTAPSYNKAPFFSLQEIFWYCIYQI